MTSLRNNGEVIDEALSACNKKSSEYGRVAYMQWDFGHCESL